MSVFVHLLYDILSLACINFTNPLISDSHSARQYYVTSIITKDLPLLFVCVHVCALYVLFLLQICLACFCCQSLKNLVHIQ